MRPFSFLMNPRRAFPALAFALVLALTWFVYAPGLAGGFLFDDFVNLPALGAYGPIDNWTAFWQYVTSGVADPTGRPLALLSFLIDARDWPADTWSFKRTSVALHLINGGLLALLLTCLGRVLPSDTGKETAIAHSDWAAVLGAALWTLHPLFVSTTLYVVQREAMLPATFILLGLLGYIWGRQRAVEGSRSGIWLAAASVVVCTALAVLSKANGVLLPLLTWVIEAFLLAPRRPITHPATTRRFHAVQHIVLVAPSLLLAAWLAFTAVNGFLGGFADAHRPWTLAERLLTEARIVVEYLGLLWIPQPYSRGLFNDGYVVSTGLLSPPSTVICIIFIAGLLVFAFAQRKKYPALAAAIAFFFAGHLMESSVIALELYFEHRNYVPAMLMFWPLALWLCTPNPHAEPAAMHADTARRVLGIMAVRRFLAVSLPMLFAVLTYLGSDLWGNVGEQGLLWAAQNPQSPRAQAYAAQIEISEGKPHAAAARLATALTRFPDEIQLALNLVDARCKGQNLTSQDMERAAASLRTTRKLGKLAYNWIDSHTNADSIAVCRELDLDAIERLVEAMAANPQVATLPGRQQDVYALRGRIALLRGNATLALSMFDAAYDADPAPAAALQQASTLAASGHPDLGLRHLEHMGASDAGTRKAATGMPAIHAWLLRRQGYWIGETEHLRNAMLEDLHQRESPSP